MRMKKPSGGRKPHYGWLKMNGKISVILGCNCCDAYNFKWRERWKEALKEIRQDS